MNIKEAVKIACEEPTLLDALSWICVWESERIIKQAKENKIINVDTGARWETCFKHCLREVLNQYNKETIYKSNIIEDPDFRRYWI